MSDESVTNPTSINEDFKTAVRDYIQLSDEINEKQEEVKEKRKRMKKLSEFILGFMKDNDKEYCNLGDSGMLMIKQKKTKTTLNKDNLHKMMLEYFNNDESKANDSVEYIISNQTTKETEYLHRTKN